MALSGILFCLLAAFVVRRNLGLIAAVFIGAGVGVTTVFAGAFVAAFALGWYFVSVSVPGGAALGAMIGAPAGAVVAQIILMKMLRAPCAARSADGARADLLQTAR